MPLKVALHASLSLTNGDTANTVRACAQAAGFDDVKLVAFNGSIDLMDEMAPAKDSVLDLIIAPFALADTTFAAILDEMRVELPFVYSIGFDNTAEHAAAASAAAIDGLLVEPVSKERFEEELARVLAGISRLHAASFILSSSVGDRRVPFHSFYYSETAGHDQIVHFEDGRSLAARYSSQALFDLLAEDGRFFKVGSSYIVNLNEVDELNTPAGTLTLSNGTKLSVPFRIRKPLERTLLEW